jgi:hypothetical protein
MENLYTTLLKRRDHWGDQRVDGEISEFILKYRVHGCG